MSIVAELPGVVQLFSDGSITRFPIPTTEASPDFSSGYKSKDVVIDAAKPITARIFVPDTGDELHPLPVIVYYHGGGFCIGSTAWSAIHGYLGILCAKSQAIILSVDYRLAPEHRIPAAFEDGYDSLQWLAANSSFEPWLERSDLSRVFLSGESAGGNIVHNVMLRVARSRIEGVSVKGLMIIHPFFGGEERVKNETVDGAEKWVAMSDVLWRMILPEGADRDHPVCNFEKGVIDVESLRQFPAVTVFVAGLDVLKERGVMYADFLKGKVSEEVGLVITEGEEHSFHFKDHESEATLLLVSQMEDFMKQR